MSNRKVTLERPRVVCHVDSSSTAAAVVAAAASYCRLRGAELVAVRVVEPSSFGTTAPFPVDGPGTWGLLGAAAFALELARKQGVPARVVVRIGDAATMLDEERRAVGAERVFTRADVAEPRSPGRGVSRRAPAAARSRRRSRRTSPSAPPRAR